MAMSIDHSSGMPLIRNRVLGEMLVYNPVVFHCQFFSIWRFRLVSVNIDWLTRLVVLAVVV
jgi:hypothetical protein